MAQTQGTWHLVNPTSLILCKQLNELQTFINIKIAQLKQHVCQSPSHPFPHTLSQQDQLGKLQDSDESDLAAPLPWLCLLNTVHHAGHEEWSRGATCPDRATRIFLKILRNILLNRVKDIFSLEFPRKHHKISNRYNVNICQHHKKVRGVRAGSSFPCRLFSKDVLVPIC